MNALAYCKKGLITIRLRRIKENLEFYIKDEGIGIPTLASESIFKSFIVSSKTYTPSGWRGIGLTLYKKVIEIYNGKIWVESDCEKGATFKFIFNPNYV